MLKRRRFREFRLSTSAKPATAKIAVGGSRIPSRSDNMSALAAPESSQLPSSRSTIVGRLVIDVMREGPGERGEDVSGRDDPVKWPFVVNEGAASPARKTARASIASISPVLPAFCSRI
jgi:hypothetical protein